MSISAIYEKGMIKPLVKLGLDEKTDDEIIDMEVWD